MTNKTNALLTSASRRWGVDFVRLRPDRPLAGSPERTDWRGVVEADDGRLFVLEKIPSRAYARKRGIAAVLQRLSDLGLQQILPYLPDVDGEWIPLIGHGLWQMCPYVGGAVLDRPAYTRDGWRGDAVAAFLIRFNDICAQHPLPADAAPFSIATYSRQLFATLARRQPKVADRYRPFILHLEKWFAPVHDRLPIGFCHGDIHPLNIIWGAKTIRAVIDWEFCGPKPEIYDLANLLGCLGIEDPNSLRGPFAQRLIHRLQAAGVFSEASWRALPDLMLAIRFAWLSEWLRKDDQPMIRLEADYMDLLIHSRTELALLFVNQP